MTELIAGTFWLSAARKIIISGVTILRTEHGTVFQWTFRPSGEFPSCWVPHLCIAACHLTVPDHHFPYGESVNDDSDDDNTTIPPDRQKSNTTTVYPHIAMSSFSPRLRPSREGSVSSSSESASLVSSRFSTTSASSPTINNARSGSCGSLSDWEIQRLELNGNVIISFVKGGKLFRLRYAFIDICKDWNGNLRSLELGGGVGQQTAFIHSFHNIRLPVPHLEHPKLPNDIPLRVSFLEDQTVQTAHTVFSTQLTYTFDGWEDCVRFQEALLTSELVFIAGIAEAKSKGRGEECISQNLRILRGKNGKQTLLFFANSQRKELKRYLSIPINCIDHINPGKKAGRPVVLELQPNFDILSQMKSLQVTFLDENDRKEFCQLLSYLQN